VPHRSPTAIATLVLPLFEDRLSFMFRSTSRLTMRAIVLLICCAACGLSGCGRQSADQSIDAALKTANKTKLPVLPLAGTVTVDGAPAKLEGPDKKFVLLIYEIKDKTVTQNMTRTFADADGKFSFSMYKEGDGVPAGKYVIAFAELTHPRKGGFVGPDGLNNLYNDPQKNLDNPEFVIEQKEPGKSDYRFDLKVAGKDPVTTPGPQAFAGQHNAGGKRRNRGD
jgi:hypothetical protein